MPVPLGPKDKVQGYGMKLLTWRKLIIDNLNRRKGRVALTAMGVVIGTAAVDCWFLCQRTAENSHRTPLASTT